MNLRLVGLSFVVSLGAMMPVACTASAPSGVSSTSSSGGGTGSGSGSGPTSDAGSATGGGSSSGGGSNGAGSSGAGSSGAGSSGGSSDAGTPPPGSPEAGPSDAGDGGLGGTTNGLGTIIGSPAVARLLALTKNCTAANKIASDPGDFVLDNGMVANVCSLPGGPGNPGGAVYFTADMDIDCDGLTTTHCPGTGADKDPSYYDQTSFAGPNSAKNAEGQPTLASESTPYVVIPEEVVYPGVDQTNGGNIVLVLYNNQIEFAVFGDQIAAQPGQKGEPIGEASVRTANGLGIPSSPATGGVGGGVTYIVFAGMGSQPMDMENIPEIQSLGVALTEALLANNP